MRVAVVSCCSQSESTTPYLLNELFHIDSVHRADYKSGCATSNEFIAEVGCSFLNSENEEECSQPMLVTHVVGDFPPLWPFLVSFVDHVIVEDNSDQERNFYKIFHSTPEGKQLVDDINDMNEKLGNDAAPYVILWKPSTKNKGCYRKKVWILSSVYRMPAWNPDWCARLHPHLFKRLSGLATEFRHCLYEMTILQDYDFEPVKCMPPVEIESIVEQQSAHH